MLGDGGCAGEKTSRVLPCIGLQSGGYVHGQQRGGAGVQLLQQCQQWLWHRAGAQTYTQQGVNAQVLWAQCGGVFDQRNAGLLCALPRLACIGRAVFRITQPGHGHVHALAVQVHGGLQAIAAVVAGATGNPDGARVRCQRPGQLRHSQARALHQGVRGQRGSSVVLDALGGRRIKQRVRPMWGDALHGVPVVVGACPRPCGGPLCLGGVQRQSLCVTNLKSGSSA